ncbi:MAG: hypothetical protein JO032_02500 [Alphaproteobacteria bacterium]|nr:hypothetical protein [Alphaproteobacteria bacterium]MBV9551642.1 hypothetical protein [Alphaproteobacteria bacterium]
MMSTTVLQIIGILAVIAIFVIVFVRPAGVLFAILAAAVVIAAIAVSWRDVEDYRHQRQETVTSQQAIDAATAAAAGENAPVPAAQRGS